MKLSDIRRVYIEFFKKKGHVEIPSGSLVPENDPTTLFTGSGMQPLVPYLLGEPHPLGVRLVNSQLAFRAEDIDEVGDNRHTTFFEMLGNWSLGDYFKKEQLPWFAEFLVEVLKLPIDKLYVTIFAGNEYAPKDTQSIEIWQSIFQKYGLEARVGERIFEYSAKKNWWSRSGEPANMPIGEPGGPSSEVFYEFATSHDSQFGESCHLNCDCGRFMEIGNSVFMQYKKTTKGVEPLKNNNVDFGGGLERLAAATNNDPDIFRIDVFTSIIQIIEELSHKNYGNDTSDTRAMRIIADHMRGATMLLATGVTPANKKQGYIVRRLIRRAILYGKKLGFGFTADNLVTISQKIIGEYIGTHPELFQDKQRIIELLRSEGAKFGKTLDKGLKEISKLKTLDGKVAFYLYESFGFPLELTLEIAKERGQDIDPKVFSQEFAKHQNASRSASSGMFKGGLADTSAATIRLHTANHLLQAALRQVLGTHVRQKGSNITAERLRFDFTHAQALTSRELVRVENLVNEQIKKDLPVEFSLLPYEQAINQGALFVPGVTYAQKVKVYSIGAPSTSSGQVFSKEICGGPHVHSTKQVGRFKIIKQQHAGSGIQRIYATVSL